MSVFDFGQGSVLCLRTVPPLETVTILVNVASLLSSFWPFAWRVDFEFLFAAMAGEKLNHLPTQWAVGNSFSSGVHCAFHLNMGENTVVTKYMIDGLARCGGDLLCITTDRTLLLFIVSHGSRKF